MMRRATGSWLPSPWLRLLPPPLPDATATHRSPSRPARWNAACGWAQLTAQALDASGADVVVLARAGQDLSKYGLRYSHLGFAYRQPDAELGHVWRVLHKLNHCGFCDSAIYRQGLGSSSWTTCGATRPPGPYQRLKCRRS